MRYLQLGASLYVPGTRGDLAAVGNGRKFPGLRSVIFCTEDAIYEADLPHALRNLEAALPRLEPAPTLRFIRPRSPAVLRTLLQTDGIRNVTGFVLPKVTPANLDDWFAPFRPDDPFDVMPTLETVEAFDPSAMAALRSRLLEPACRRRVLSLRIGGNDLFHLLGLRRPRGRSLYATPLGPVVSQLVAAFRPHGFNLTAPVFEYLNHKEVLARETRRDLAHGLFGKAAVHPDQVPVIEAQYRVSARDVEAAERILAREAPAVFRLHDSMCEPAVHREWAAHVLARAELYGVRARQARARHGENGKVHD